MVKYTDIFKQRGQTPLKKKRTGSLEQQQKQD